MAYNLGEIPLGCTTQKGGLSEFKPLTELPPSEIVRHFHNNAEAVKRLLNQSYDKRYSPSTFIEEVGDRIDVGWFDGSRLHVQRFTDVSEAATDYLLFSFGIGRLNTR